MMPTETKAVYSIYKTVDLIPLKQSTSTILVMNNSLTRNLSSDLLQTSQFNKQISFATLLQCVILGCPTAALV